MWLLRSSKGKERAAQVVGESSRNRSLDDVHPPRTSTSSESSTLDAETAAVHTLKYQRSQFLRLFGRKTLSTKSSTESLRSLKSVSSASSLRNLVRDVPCDAPMGKADPDLRIPDLPSEIWIYIFQLVSNTPHRFLRSIAEPPDSSSTSNHGEPKSSPPISFLDYPNSHRHLYQAYKEMMASKILLTQVCKYFHAIGQVVVFEFIWINNRGQAERLLKQLDEKALKRPGQTNQVGEAGKDGVKGSESGTGLGQGAVTTASAKGKGKGKEKDTGATKTFDWDTRDLGRYIRRIHIETSSSPFAQCSSDTVLKILEHATGLQVFSDSGSIRRNPRWSVSSVSSVVVGDGTPLTTTLPLASGSNPSSLSLAPYSYTTSTSITSVTSEASPSASSSISDLFDSGSSASSSTSVTSLLAISQHTPPPTIPLSTDDSLLSALLSPKPEESSSSLRRLSFTSYHHPCSRPSSESTETDIANIFDASIRYFQDVVSPKLRLASGRLEFLELTLCAEDLGGGGLLESLVGDARAGLGAGVAGAGVAGVVAEPLSFPKLTALKVTLDNATFHVLSTWDMPSLVNLSVISADFSYAGDGFREFFEAHGSKLKQLELGHSTEAIEDHFAGSSPFAPYIPQPHSSPTTTDMTEADGFSYGGMRVPLAEWCPILEVFACSANAEWNWQNPDWIAPHVLLPAHPTLELIGVRDLHTRIQEGIERCERADIARAEKGSRTVGIEVRDKETGAEIKESGDGAFFMLIEQFSSIFDRNAFPSLKYVRDLSWESGVMRTTGVGAGSAGTGSTMGGGNGRGSGDVRRDYGVGMVRGFLEALRPSSHRHGASTTDPSQPSERELREAEVARRLAKQQHRRVLRFWMRVLEMCKERGVYLEDCEGLNITVSDLRRAAASVGR